MQFIFGTILLFFLFYGDPDIFDLLHAFVFKYLSGL